MNLTTRRTALLTAIAAVVIVAIWYAALFRPQSSHLKAARAAYATSEQQVHKLQDQVRSLQALEKQIPADKARLGVLDAAVPTSADLTAVLDQLHQLATSSGVELTTVNPGQATSSAASSSSSAKPAAGTLESIQLQMSASGSYSQLSSFLSDLASMPRALVVDSLQVSPGNSGLTSSINARIFFATS